MATRTWLNIIKEIASCEGYSINKIGQELDISMDEFFNVLANVNSSRPSKETTTKLLWLHDKLLGDNSTIPADNT